jgi:AcrR family transcriptional regulator
MFSEPSDIIVKDYINDYPLDLSSISLKSLEEFRKSFPLREDVIYQYLFTVYNKRIETQKATVATNNLRRILEGTFAISSSSNFNRMSLRDLSKESGLSLGAIYSCINKKEDIVNMVGSVVELSTRITANYGLLFDDPKERIEKAITYHVHASHELQAWYFFLYFETRNLSTHGQLRSKKIETATGDFFEAAIKNGVQKGLWKCDNPTTTSYVIVTMLEDWYLKPWKYQTSEDKNANITDYAQNLTNFIFNCFD